MYQININYKSILMVFQFYLKLPDDAMVTRYLKTNITKSCSKMPKTDEIRGKLSKNIFKMSYAYLATNNKKRY